MHIGLYGEESPEAASKDYLDQDGVPKEYSELPEVLFDLLGKLITSTASLDASIEGLLDILAKPPAYASAAILFEGESADWKITKCERLLEQDTEANPEAKEEVRRLLRTARSLFHERGKCAHCGFWQHNPITGKIAGSRNRRHGKSDEWFFTVADLRKLVAQVVQTEMELISLTWWPYWDLWESRQEPEADSPE